MYFSVHKSDDCLSNVIKGNSIQSNDLSPTPPKSKIKSYFFSTCPKLISFHNFEKSLGAAKLCFDLPVVCYTVFAY